MKKSDLRKVIKEIIQNEMARIPSLFNLSTTNDAEIEAKLPDALKKNRIAKEIIDFYKNNGNQPSKREDIVAAYGYPQTATIGSIFKAMQVAGLVVNNGLARPKAEKPQVTHHADRFGAKETDKQKLDLVIYRLRHTSKVDDNKVHSEWFIGKFGEENWQKLKQIINSEKDAITKDQIKLLKAQMREFLTSLGFRFREKASSPIPVRTPGEDGVDKVSYKSPDEEDSDDETDFEDDNLGGAY